MAGLLDDAEEKNLGWPLEGEIDILEWTGHEPHRLIRAIHFGDLPPDNVHYSGRCAQSSMERRFPSLRYSVVANRVAWYVDDRIHGVATLDDIAPWPWVFDDKAFHLILNMAVGARWWRGCAR